MIVKMRRAQKTPHMTKESVIYPPRYLVSGHPLVMKQQPYITNGQTEK